MSTSQQPQSRSVSRWLALVIAVPLLIAAACSSNGSAGEEEENEGEPAATTSAGTSDCAPATANAAAKPPADIPTPTGATFYETSKAGETTLYFAYASGDDVKVTRDAIKDQLEKAGYEIKGTDAEDNEEAELEFEGKGHNESSVQVIHREGCDGQLRIRFRLGG